MREFKAKDEGKPFIYDDGCAATSDLDRCTQSLLCTLKAVDQWLRRERSAVLDALPPAMVASHPGLTYLSKRLNSMLDDIRPMHDTGFSATSKTFLQIARQA